MSRTTDQTRTIVVQTARRRVGGLVALALGLGAVVVAGLLLASVGLPDLLGSTTREQPNAVTLAKIQDVAEFQAATGRFETVVDVEDDANYLPDWVKGERKVLVAEGDVTAAVDLSGLDEDALEVSPDGKQATVHLPAPTLQGTQLDRASSRVVARDRGLLDRVDDALTSGNPSADDELYARAEEKLHDAATQSDLQRRAEENTTEMVTGLLTDAGYEQVTVLFDAPPADAPATAA